MPLDGIVISALVNELNDTLEFGKIERVHQPENDAIILVVRKYREQHKVLLSVNSNYPQVCLTDKKRENPAKPPMFCMLLRKYLQGGKILEVSQNAFDRIITFKIESRDELGKTAIINLVVELMGKHSNIILVNSETNKIMDSIKRVPEHVSSVRQILPNLSYTEQPMVKTNLFDSSFDDFMNTINEDDTDKQVYKFLYTKYQGISPTIAREIIVRTGLFEDIYFSELSTVQMQDLWTTIDWLKTLVQHKKFQPNVIFDKHKNSVDFSSIILKRFSSEDYRIVVKETMSQTIESYYYNKSRENKYKQKSTNLRKTIQTRLNRLYKKSTKLKEELYFAENSDIYKIKGELLIANLHTLTSGMSEVTVTNYYEADAPELTIHLDVRLTPSENAQRFFKRYNKLKTAIIEVKHQLEEAKAEIDYLENVSSAIETSLDVSNLDSIRDELAEQGYLKKRVQKKVRKEKKKATLLEYRSSQGYRIIVGRNNTENDYLTLKYASNSDTWLHTKIIPGSHVVIRAEGKEVPYETLEEAAKIAAWHSKARASENVPVDFTLIKNVKKPSGAKPGMVIYSTNQTLYVTPVEEEVVKLFAKK